MTVIVTSPEGRNFVFTKGADSLLMKKVMHNPKSIQPCEENLVQLAKKGLRTLLMVYKEITDEELIEWETIYKVY